MSFGLAFWILMFIWLIGGLWWSDRWRQGSAVWGPDLFYPSWPFRMAFFWSTTS